MTVTFDSMVCWIVCVPVVISISMTILIWLRDNRLSLLSKRISPSPAPDLSAAFAGD